MWYNWCWRTECAFVMICVMEMGDGRRGEDWICASARVNVCLCQDCKVQQQTKEEAGSEVTGGLLILWSSALCNQRGPQVVTHLQARPYFTILQSTFALQAFQPYSDTTTVVKQGLFLLLHTIPSFLPSSPVDTMSTPVLFVSKQGNNIRDKLVSSHFTATLMTAMQVAITILDPSIPLPAATSLFVVIHFLWGDNHLFCETDDRFRPYMSLMLAETSSAVQTFKDMPKLLFDFQSLPIGHTSPYHKFYQDRISSNGPSVSTAVVSENLRKDIIANRMNFHSKCAASAYDISEAERQNADSVVLGRFPD